MILIVYLYFSCDAFHLNKKKGAVAHPFFDLLEPIRFIDD
jgi:hypothetical protein